MKQRTLKEVIDKVTYWRKLREQGVQLENGLKYFYTLEEAADVVKVPKKSLDDYYMQLKKAKDYGFDFSSNNSCMFGIVRKFNRRYEEKMKTVTKIGSAAAKNYKKGSRQSQKSDI